MIPCHHNLLEQIPDPSSLDITRMLGSMIKHGTCNTACSHRINLEQTILEMVEEKVIMGNGLVIYQGNNHNHLCHVMIDCTVLYLAKFLEEHIKHDLQMFLPNKESLAQCAPNTG